MHTNTGIDLAKYCEHVSLPNRTVLYQADSRPEYVRFLTSGVASVVNTMSSGASIEVGMFGLEAFAEATHLLGPLRGQKCSVMQVAGSAYRMEYLRFERDFCRDQRIRELVLKVAQMESLAAAQIAACNGLHGVNARLARWLLMVQDRTGEPELPLTHEYLSEMLGIRRPSISVSAGQLQRLGMIDYRRGLIRVERRDLLEGAACECYGVLRSLRDDLFR